MKRMKEWLTMTIELLVDDPEMVRVHETEVEQARIYDVTVAKVDIGKVIGRGGKTADAVRWVLYAIAGKEKKRTVLQVIDKRDY